MRRRRFLGEDTAGRLTPVAKTPFLAPSLKSDFVVTVRRGREVRGRNVNVLRGRHRSRMWAILVKARKHSREATTRGLKQVSRTQHLAPSVRPSIVMALRFRNLAVEIPEEMGATIPKETSSREYTTMGLQQLSKISLPTSTLGPSLKLQLRTRAVQLEHMRASVKTGPYTREDPTRGLKLVVVKEQHRTRGLRPSLIVRRRSHGRPVQLTKGIGTAGNGGIE